VGFIFGSISPVSLIFAYFCVPDVSGRSLEEVDQLFASDVHLRHFKSIKMDQFPQLSDGKDLEADDSVRVERIENSLSS
jgi:SP family sugar:H+ symporter-like MFS transporter